VISTAYSDYSWDQMIARIGQSDRLVILKKPFDNIEVLQLANALTEKWRLFQQAKLRMDQLEELVGERTIDLTRANEKLQGDIVWRQAAEKQRDSMEIQLRHAQKLESIGQLAAGIAHEINTPTQYIGDNVRFLSDAFRDIKQLLFRQNELLQAASHNPAAREVLREFEAAARAADVEYLLREIPKSIEQTMEGVQRVARIVGAMKEFSHPGVSEKTRIDINQAIKSTLTVSHNEWKYVAELVTDLAPDLPLVRCLPGELNKVILNLIVNAAHAIADTVQNGGATKGTITISTRHSGNWLEIRIADTGPGIPERIRTRIFDPFFTTKAVGKGTGQGLAIAHSVVVDKHGGTISFETEMGRGTTFIIRLPINE
jgi:signal transduction histidine kinase